MDEGEEVPKQGGGEGEEGPRTTAAAPKVRFDSAQETKKRRKRYAKETTAALLDPAQASFDVDWVTNTKQKFR